LSTQFLDDRHQKSEDERITFYRNVQKNYDVISLAVQTEKESIVKERNRTRIEAIEEATVAFCRTQIEVIISEVNNTLEKIKEQ